METCRISLEHDPKFNRNPIAIQYESNKDPIGFRLIAKGVGGMAKPLRNCVVTE